MQRDLHEQSLRTMRQCLLAAAGKAGSSAQTAIAAQAPAPAALLSADCAQVVEVVCCRPSQLQRDLYQHFLRSNAAQRLLASAEAGKAKASALTAINALRKLCGHPKLIYDVLHPATGKAPAEADGFKVIAHCFRPLALSCNPASATVSSCHSSHHGYARLAERLRTPVCESLSCVGAGLWAVLSTWTV